MILHPKETIGLTDDFTNKLKSKSNVTALDLIKNVQHALTSYNSPLLYDCKRIEHLNEMVIIFRNVFDFKLEISNITNENYNLLKSGYVERDGILQLERWFQFPLECPKSKWIIIRMKSADKIEEEYKNNSAHQTSFMDIEDVSYKTFDYSWGIYQVLGIDEPNIPPKLPQEIISDYMDSNTFNKQVYKESVKFWQKNAIVL